MVVEKNERPRKRGIRVAWRKDIRGGRFISARTFIHAESREPEVARDERTAWLLRRHPEGRKRGKQEEKPVLRDPFVRHPPNLHYVFLLAFPFLYFVMPIYRFRAMSAFMQFARRRRTKEKKLPSLWVLWRCSLVCF